MASRGGILASAGMLAALLLSACGGGSTSAANSSTTSTSRPGTADTVAPTSTSTEASATTAAGGGSSPSGGTITSVVFTGTSDSPTVTINGANLGQMPAANPSYTPEGHQLCPVPPSGNQGYDYGTNLYLFNPDRNWAGGRYRPDLGELDCIGLVVSKFTPSQIVFTLGSAYAQYGASKNYVLAEGDNFQAAVNGAMLQGKVHYTT